MPLERAALSKSRIARPNAAELLCWTHARFADFQTTPSGTLPARDATALQLHRLVTLQ